MRLVDFESSALLEDDLRLGLLMRYVSLMMSLALHGVVADGWSREVHLGR